MARLNGRQKKTQQQEQRLLVIEDESYYSYVQSDDVLNTLSISQDFFTSQVYHSAEPLIYDWDSFPSVRSAQRKRRGLITAVLT